MSGERCPDCGARMLGYCLLCRIDNVPGDDELTKQDIAGLDADPSNEAS